MKYFFKLPPYLKVLLYTFIFLLFQNVSFASESFEQWFFELKKEAISKGISQKTLSYIDNLRPIQKTIALDRNQPEFKMTLESYSRKLININRINKGKSEIIKNKNLLEKISKKYGVQKRYIIALWAIESDFGRNMGNFNTLQSLITLSFDGRRSKYFRNELFSALYMIERNMVKNPNLIGSWAGAMGQCQFMPSAFLSYAQDWDGDGFKDIWNNRGDIFASIANYLKNVGWNSNYIWGRVVDLKNVNNRNLIDNKTHFLSYWSRIGVKTINNNHLPKVKIKGRIVNPDNDTKAFLVYENYESLLKWNRSHHFAITVGLLSDKIIEN